MNDQLAKTDGSKDLIQFDDDKVALIKRTVAEGATDDELELFLHQCRKTGLDPLAKQIYFQKYDTKRGPRISIITGIDGYRVVADRTGTYAGSDEPEFEGRITQQRYRDSKQVPAKATVTVWKIVGGKRVPFTASAYWKEYYPGDKKGHMWFKMPHVMLGKVAEAQALRKAFPADLSGVYTREEMDQAEWTETVEPTEDRAGVAAVRPEQGSQGEELVDEFAHERTTEPEPEPTTNGDSRGAASPQAQAKRERPKAEPDEDEDIDHLKAALNATSLKEMAEHAAQAIDGYDGPEHVVGALLNKIYPDGFQFDAEKTDEYMNKLADRKAETEAV